MMSKFVEKITQTIDRMKLVLPPAEYQEFLAQVKAKIDAEIANQ